MSSRESELQVVSGGAQRELSAADRVAIAGLTEGLREARRSGDERPAFVIVSAFLDGVGVPRPDVATTVMRLEDAKDEWLERLRSSSRSASTLTGYRVALEDLIAYQTRVGTTGQPLDDSSIVAYLNDYRLRRLPAAATYYRRFMLLRRFFHWLSGRSVVPDPFLTLESPPKPQQEANWLTPDEFAQLLAAAGAPDRRREGLAERDQLVLLALVATGLRRSELLAVDWTDVDLDPTRPTLLVRRGKGGKPRRQPLVPELATRLRELRAGLDAKPGDPVFCGLEGKRLQAGILAAIIRRAADRASLGKKVSAHTLRHTAATWLRQQTGDARLVAAYLGHADLSTVSRYAHVAEHELHDAAAAIARAGHLGAALEMVPPRC